MKEYVYFIRGEGTNMVKIGKTNHEGNRRKKEIQNMSPVWLYNLGKLAVRDAYKIEREMHELLAPYRTWGEWFEFPEEDIGTLKRCIRSKKKSRRHRNGIVVFDYESFKNYWRREFGY